MNTLLANLVEIGQTSLIVGFLVFLRVGAAMALLPAFGEQSIPQRVRLVLTLCFTAIVTPAVAGQITPMAETRSMMPFGLVTEVIAGLAIGVVLRLFVVALQVAGATAAQATSLSQILGNAGVDPAPAIGQILLISGVALAVMAGLHVRFAEVMIISYDLMPVGQFPDSGILAEWGTARIAHAFGLAFSLAAPFVIASLIYNVALGVINRAMPQLMVSFVGAPAISAGGLLLLFLTVPIVLFVWSRELSTFLANPFGAY